MDVDAHSQQNPAGPSGDVTGELAALLPELGLVALYELTPHHRQGGRPTAEPLTGRQLEAVVFVSDHRRVTMGEFADGLESAGRRHGAWVLGAASPRRAWCAARW